MTERLTDEELRQYREDIGRGEASYQQHLQLLAEHAELKREVAESMSAVDTLTRLHSEAGARIRHLEREHLHPCGAEESKMLALTERAESAEAGARELKREVERLTELLDSRELDNAKGLAERLLFTRAESAEARVRELEAELAELKRESAHDREALEACHQTRRGALAKARNAEAQLAEARALLERVLADVRQQQSSWGPDVRKFLERKQ